MTTASPRLGLTIPNADGSDDADLAALLRALGLDVENKSPGITALTTAARIALTGAAMFDGRLVYDTDLYTLFLGDGTTWRALARLDTSGHLPMAGKRITGLAAGVANGDAVRLEQLAPVYAIGVRDSNITLTNNSWWTVSYTSETDPSSILSSGVVTLPSAGLWLVTGSVTLSLTEFDGMNMMLEQNNAAISGIPYGTYVKMGTSTQQTLQHTALVYASASDVIRMRVWAYNAGGGSRECVGARLSVAKIGL